MTHGIGVFVAGQLRDLPVKAAAPGFGVLVLWLVDGVSILTAYLSTPAELPLLRWPVRMG